MRVGLPLAAILVASLLAGCTDAGPPHSEMPEKLREAGFLSDLDAGLAKAKKEDKLVLVYLTPSWFT
jgi:hypothetical protein